MTNEKETNSLPPKTCTIERLVTLKDDVSKVISGKKTATRRNGRYADINEIMELDGHNFIVEKVYTQKLGDMTDEDASREGYSDLEAYTDSILSIHPGMKWAPKLSVWVHEYKQVQG